MRRPTAHSADGGAFPLTEAGPSATGPRIPQAILGAAGAVQADVVLVMVVVNAEVIRRNPVGARMGYLLRGIPQWDEFMSGTDIDPVRDTDWVMISGPSLVNTTRDVVLIHYSASDAVVDKAIDVVSRKYDRGGPHRRRRAGRQGVPRARGPGRACPSAAAAARPRGRAAERRREGRAAARRLEGPGAHPPGEAVYLRLVNPHHPMPEIPATITEMRLRVVPRPDEGADVFIDGDTKDAQTASEAAEDVKGIVRRHNDTFTSLATHGLLDHVDVAPEGNLVRLHLTASRRQIETLVNLVGSLLGVSPSGAAVPPAPRRP